MQEARADFDEAVRRG
jgi:hypothetical protein